MHFTVFAFSPIPDLVTARHNFALHGLADKEVTQVLFHQRKQRTGYSETLNWDQQAIASMSLVQHHDGDTRLIHYALPAQKEKQLLQLFLKAYHQASQLAGTAVFWQAESRQLPLLHFRFMKNSINDDRYWADIQSQQGYVDLCQWLTPTGGETPLLHDMAQRFYYPGMQNNTLETVWQAYLNQDYASISRYSDYQALNTYLLALKVFTLEGKLDTQDADNARQQLYQQLLAQETYADFIAHWEHL